MTSEGGSSYRIYSGFHTDVGKLRERNEDALWQGSVPLGYLALVADGMGGHQMGDKAASLTVHSVAEEVQKERTDPGLALRKGFERANRELRSEAADLHVTMGATCAAALVHKGRLYVAHVGDARAYLLRAAGLYHLTRDHSLMQEIADIKGPVAATEFAPTLKHIMSRSVGAEQQIDVALRSPIDLRAGDVILLCTDGLSSAVSDVRIRRTLAGATPREAARRLVEAANDESGEDNISAIVLRIDTDRASEAPTLITFDDLAQMFVRTTNGDLHPIVDVSINTFTWTVAGLHLDLRNAERGAECSVAVSDVGPIPPGGQTIQSPQSTESLLDLARGHVGRRR